MKLNFFKIGLVYDILIKFAHCTGSKLGGLKKWPFGDYWEIVDFFRLPSQYCEVIMEAHRIFEPGLENPIYNGLEIIPLSLIKSHHKTPVKSKGVAHIC